MHELGVVFHVIKTVENLARENGLTEIKSVTLEVGEVSTVIEEYLRKCWKWSVAKKSTMLKETELHIETIPAITYCEGCGQTYETVKHGKICPYCSSPDTYLIQGNEFNMKEMEAK